MLASDPPQKIVLLKYMDSKMIRKNFRSTKESIPAVCYQPTEDI